MKREIKFRALKKHTKEWAIGNLVTHSNDTYIAYGSVNDKPLLVEVLDKTVGQYTGLKDRDGKEIYEDDIVRFISWINEYNPEEIVVVRPVKFENGCFSPHPTHEECEDGYYSWGLKDFEVIGNIHQNPELIK